MDKSEIEARLRVSYPTGQLNEFDSSTLIPEFYLEMILNALSSISKICEVSVTDLSFLFNKTYMFTLVQKKHPAYGKWSGNSQEWYQEWYQVNKSEYVAYFLYFSRVWPGYFHFFNIWRMGEKELKNRLDFTYDPPNEEWELILKQIEKEHDIPGMTHFTEEELLTEIPIVLKEDWDSLIEDEIQGLPVDDDAVPATIPATLKECLFDDM